MVGILLVAHNHLGESLADCVVHVLGAMPSNLKVLSVFADEDTAQKLLQGQVLIKQLDMGSGVLILADVLGATPSNISRQLCHGERVMGVAGVNLPMLLRVICQSSKNLPELVKAAVEGGRECIVEMNREE